MKGRKKKRPKEGKAQREIERRISEVMDAKEKKPSEPEENKKG